MENTEKKYLVQYKWEDETCTHLWSIRELAERYDTDQIAGLGCEYEVFDVDTFGKVTPVKWFPLVDEYLDNKRWMEREYEDYCNDLRYADWN